MKILMLGWEFPPYFAGGVGVACAQMAKALNKKGVEITYLMPSGPENISADFAKILVANNIDVGKLKIRKVDSLLTAYITSGEYDEQYKRWLQNKGAGSAGKIYGENLMQEIYNFAQKAKLIAETEDFDVIHAQDWVTFPAALEIKKATRKPMVAHVHITEFDKTGGMHASPEYYAVEREGMMGADLVIANSHYTKNNCINRYYIPPEKIRVVHNAAEFTWKPREPEIRKLNPHDKIVLFLGRMTLQKGPDYFVEAARRVLEYEPNVTFVMAGIGDMWPRMVERTVELGISHKFVFTGFVSREQGDRLYRMADLFVMPSVSEPFGIVPLEAIYNGAPAIISKQSGVTEVLRHCLKVDFWDVDDMANKMISALHYPTLHESLKEYGFNEVLNMSWEKTADRLMEVYCEAIH